ncbi:MAG: PAS domain S-box protein [Nitrospirae bacterium]|nr:PAS domain S-box protein [Nitrospirota bacterium]
MRIQLVFLAAVLLVFLFFGNIPAYSAADSPNQQVKIGVLAYRGAETALTMWGPTADYLSKNIPRNTFSIVPLGFHEIGPAVERGDVDFVLANSSIYVELEARYNANRIATLRNDGLHGGQTVFGGVIFCLADRSDINSLGDLKGKSFLAVDEASLGGWQVAWRELKKSGLDPYRDFSGLHFSETTHDDVVYAIRDGKADAGTVRTDTLERMTAEGKIDIRAFRILNQQEKGFPFQLSTRLYPEWPLAATRNTDIELAEQVAVALFGMPHDSSAAKAGKITGWTIPLVYQPVHDLMKELRLGPYKDYGNITVADVFRQYWRWIVFVIASIIIMIILTLHALRLNKYLVRSNQLVEEARNGLEQKVQARTVELQTANEELSNEIAERRKTEETLRKLSRAVEQSPATIVITDASGVIEYVNPKFTEITGYSADEAIGKNPRILQSGETLREEYDRLWEALRAGHEWHGEFCNKKKNGELYWESATIAPIMNSEGTVTHYVAVKEDITRHREAQEQIRQAKEEWERTFDAIADPLMILDTNYHIIKANKSMADALGVTPVRAVGMTCYESVHGTTAPPDYCPHAKLLADGQARSLEIHEPRLGGHYFITVSPLCAANGTLIGSIHSARDISVLKKAEEMSKQYSRDLERLLSISRDTTVTTDLKGLYRSFISVSQELLNFDFSTLLLLSEDRMNLTVADILGFPESLIGHFSLAEGQGLSSLVLKNKRAETVADFLCENRFEVPAIVGEKGIHSAVAVPMLMKDEVIGVLIGHTLQRREFSKNEINIYQHIANNAAVAIRNAMNTDMLRKKEKYVRDVTAALGEGVYVLDPRGNVTFMNPEAEALLGWSEKELIHKNIHDVIHNRRADGTTLLFDDCEMRKVIETGNRFHSTEEVFVRKDRTVFPVSVHSRPLMEDGKIIASVTAFRDISERKQRELERESLIAELQKALAEIKTLHGILPICSYCKKIRDDKGAWIQMESYISKHTDSQFSHGICKECAKKEFPQYFKEPGGRDEAESPKNS